MTSELSITGTILRSADGTFYYIPASELEGWRVPDEAARAIEAWSDSMDTSGHAAETVRIVGSIDLSSTDDEVVMVRTALDPLIGPSSMLRRTFVVLPPDEG
jgi:hypothetical protein